MTNWQIDESEGVTGYLQRPEVNVGDTIEVMTNNQEGYRKYKVILSHGNKNLMVLADWSIGIYEESENEDEGITDDEQNGGNKRRKNRRRKTRKSKRSSKISKNRKSKMTRRY